MKVDPDLSVFQEGDFVREDFTRKELHRARALLRRLRFLETKVREADPGTSNAFVMTEMEALEWVLTEVGFLAVNDETHVSASR